MIQEQQNPHSTKRSIQTVLILQIDSTWRNHHHRYNVGYHFGEFDVDKLGSGNVDFDLGDFDFGDFDLGDLDLDLRGFVLFSRAATRLLSLPKFLSICFNQHAHGGDSARVCAIDSGTNALPREASDPLL